MNSKLFYRSIKQSPAYAAIPDLQRPSPSGYPKFADLALHMVAAQLMLGELGNSINSVAAAYAACGMAANTNAPLIHLPRELGQAFIATAAPTFLAELLLPYPSFVLNLPQGLLFSDAGEAVLALVVADPKTTTEWFKGPWRTVDESDLIVAGILSTGALEYLHLDLALLIQAANQGLPEREVYEVEPYVGLSQITSELARLALNAILLLQARPELLTEESASALPRRGFGSAPYKGSIRWLGKDYRRSTSSGSSSSSGSGNSKAPHWRRGHWHQVPCGVGRTERRLRWFEPVYVNGTTSMAA